ncbi:hypothetical protein BDF14DRAFT_1994754 [Spinellus fusiger]|nr:hypothetical protein BDF14DRAFT_1994753 [Spinellus fusiger]KAI7869163.1 hypothetical protein BDF14DRAFT_1994754 [Spinellus fusiger]
MQLGYDLIHRIDAKFINVSNSDGERQSERREETPYRNRNSSASRDLNEQTRSSEHLAESCSVCLSAGTSTASFVSAAPALSLGKRKHESEESSDKKGKKKAKIEEEKEEEKEAEEEKAEEVEEAEEAEEVGEVGEEAAVLGGTLLPNFSLFMPIGIAHRGFADGSSSPITTPSPPQLLTPPQLLSPPSPPRAATTRRGPLLRRNETML